MKVEVRINMNFNVSSDIKDLAPNYICRFGRNNVLCQFLGIIIYISKWFWNILEKNTVKIWISFDYFCIKKTEFVKSPAALGSKEAGKGVKMFWTFWCFENCWKRGYGSVSTREKIERYVENCHFILLYRKIISHILTHTNS